MKWVLVIACLFLNLCGFVEDPNKAALIEKCKRERFRNTLLFMVISSLDGETRDPKASLSLLWLDKETCEDEDYTITGP